MHWVWYAQNANSSTWSPWPYECLCGTLCDHHWAYHSGQFPKVASTVFSVHCVACLLSRECLRIPQVRRKMEDENRKARRIARREYLENVRELVAFVKKRDKRVAKAQVRA